MNHTIVEKARCVLKMAKLPKSFWDEYVCTTCCLINRSSSVPFDFDNPKRLWTERNLSYCNLKIFCYKAFAHVPKEQRSKLDDKAIPYKFSGYGDDEFGYRLGIMREIRSLEAYTFTDGRGILKEELDAKDEQTLADDGDMPDDEGVEQGNIVILFLYVDDMLIVGQDRKMIKEFKKELSKSFEMKDLVQTCHILGMQIVRDRKTKMLWLSQQKYIKRVLERFNMNDAKPVSTPFANHFKLRKKSCSKEELIDTLYSSTIGSLMYAMVYTRSTLHMPLVWLAASLLIQEKNIMKQ
ncbi:hypothetical protein RJ639_018169 [Escallonia herrerae]|uniref:Reverse transcriptase Ty1/copia-type domain-containing protein n=1 Tax=Escallonia herrerae TaxID=1293975 RepID=A0AA88V817_9ASTE|nr:hypothetical protein RJ639_018169 [Escallonia herrerae]